MSNRYILTIVDYQDNIRSLAKFNRENLKCYQKKLLRTKFLCKETGHRMYTLWLVVSMDEMNKIKNYCKIKNIRTPICKEEV